VFQLGATSRGVVEPPTSNEPRDPLSFSYELAEAWPSLAWIATCEAGSRVVHVVHGRGVECRSDWFCEAVWDAPFSDGDFDQTDSVFGSGGRRRERAITFVSAGSTVDRLQFATIDGRTFVSNSLACLLEATGAQLDGSFRGYSELFEQINHGIDEELPDLPIVGGRVELCYFHNLRWDGAGLRKSPKPAPQRDFSTFEKYTGFIRSALERIAGNMASPERIAAWEWLGTISTGYDSATCAALARGAGLKRAFTWNQSRPGIRDDGLDIARCLNIDCVLVDRLAWKSQPSVEALFLAGDAQGKEAMMAGVPIGLERRVLVTGQYGGVAWNKAFTPLPLPNRPGERPAPDSLARRLHPGLSVTEYRLHAGFVHLPVPVLGLRQLPDILRLSNSPEMANWDIGGQYNRPICRRVLEEAGVPRHLFGMVKTGASIRFLRGEDAWSPASKRNFFRWLRKRGRNHGMTWSQALQLRMLLLVLEMALAATPAKAGFFRTRLRAFSFRLTQRIKGSGFNDLAFVWAMDTVRETYRRGTRVAGARQPAGRSAIARN
jgi:hypothetical protein